MNIPSPVLGVHRYYVTLVEEKAIYLLSSCLSGGVAIQRSSDNNVRHHRLAILGEAASPLHCDRHVLPRAQSHKMGAMAGRHQRLDSLHPVLLIHVLGHIRWQHPAVIHTLHLARR